MATEGMLGAVTQPAPHDGSIPSLIDAAASIGHLDGSANGNTLIRCVWSNALYPWAADVQGMFLEAGSALCTLWAKALGVQRVVWRCRGDLEMQEALGKAVQSLWMDPGAMGAVPTSAMGCGQGIW